MLVRADPDEKTISILSFPRDLRVEIRCPGQASYVDKINSAYATCGAGGRARDRPQPDGRADQLHHHGQLPRVPPARRQARRRLDGHRPAVLQRPRRPGRATRRSTSSPATSGSTGRGRSTSSASGTPTPTSTATRASSSSSASFKDQIESSFSLTKLPQVIKVITSNVEVGQGGGKDVSPKTVLRYARARVLAAAGPRLPVADRRARGLLRPDDRAGEHPARRARVPQPRRRVAAQGDRGRARREAEAEGAAAARDERARPQRQRRRGRPPSTASYLLGQRGYRMLEPPNGLPAERAELRLLPHARSTSTRRVKGAKPAAPEARGPLRLRRRQEADAEDPRARQRRDARRRHSARRSTAGSRPRRSTRRRSASRRASSPARAPPSTCCASTGARSTSR